MLSHQGYVQILFFSALLFTTCTCRSHVRTTGKSRTISCAAGQSSLNVHHFYNNNLKMLKIYADEIKASLYDSPYLTNGLDLRHQKPTFHLCMSSSNTMVQAIGAQFKIYQRTLVKMYSQLKRLQSMLVLATPSTLQYATNTLFNELKTAVCNIDSNSIVVISELDSDSTDEATFLQEYLNFVLEFSDFIHFIFENIGI